MLESIVMAVSSLPVDSIFIFVSFAFQPGDLVNASSLITCQRGPCRISGEYICQAEIVISENVPALTTAAAAPPPLHLHISIVNQRYCRCLLLLLLRNLEVLD